jgi:hypothetical protein
MKKEYQVSLYETALLQQQRKLALAEFEILITPVEDKKRLSRLTAKRDRYSRQFSLVVDLQSAYEMVGEYAI